MKRIICLVFIIIFGFSATTYAFLDSIVGGVSKTINAAYDRAYKEFMKAQMVKQTMTLMQNYRQSKIYYDRMKEINNAKGGIGGYLKKGITNRIDRQNEDLFWKLDYDFHYSNPEDTAYVKKWMQKMDEKIKAKLDYSKEIRELNLKRDKQIKQEILSKASENLKKEDREKVQLKVAVTQLEILNEMNKNIQQLMRMRAEQAAREWAEVRKMSIEQEKMKRAIERMKRKPRKKQTDPYKVLGDIPK